jgi:hypothetical protein
LGSRIVRYALLALSGPSNIEKKVRELQSSLYRQGGLASALALPAIIPLCFVEPRNLPAKRGELRDRLRRGVGKEAPYLSTGSIAEHDGFLFWDLAPRRELRRLARSCEEAFASADEQNAGRQEARPPDPLPVARGFFLCFLQGRSQDSIPSPALAGPLRFPAWRAFLLQIHPLDLKPGRSQPGRGDRASAGRMWWSSLYWEKLEEIPLRKSRATG